MLLVRIQRLVTARATGWHRGLIGIATLTIALGYVAALQDRGWIPHDEGQLGHTAERILNGDLPHRDFVEPYTGGLSYLHATAFRLGGTTSRTLRFTILPFFAIFVACTYWIANRAAPSWLAAVVTLLCACLTLPVYPASMPSWYNLFAAVCGTAALLRYLDTGRARWAMLAGLLAGLSIVVKITGLYFVAAALLFLAYREQHPNTTTSNDDTQPASVPVTRSVCFSAIVSLLLLVFAGLGMIFLRPANPIMDAVHFGLPFAGLAWVMMRGEWAQPRGSFTTRIARLAASFAPFLLGLTVPIAVLMGIFWRESALLELYQGVLVLPGRRLSGAQMAFPSPRWLLMAAPWSALLAVGFLQRRTANQPLTAIVVAALATLFAVSHTDLGNLAVQQGLRNQLPLLLAFALLMLGGRWGRNLSVPQRQELLLLAAVAFLVSLVQFPYSGGFYFFYAAPPAVLLALFIVRNQPQSPRVAHFACLVFVVAFLVLRVHWPGPAIAGGPYRPDTQTTSLQMERCDLTVRADQARLYQQLVATIKAHSPDQAVIYAAPDCPEVYFLSARKNPTKTTYELFDEPLRGTTRQTIDLLATLDRHDVRVVVLKQLSEFSTPLDDVLVAALTARFPFRQVLPSESGRGGFVVLWRS